MSDIPEVTRTRNHTFKKGTKIIVNVHGSNPPVISIPGVGALRHLVEGKHYEFVE